MNNVIPRLSSLLVVLSMAPSCVDVHDDELDLSSERLYVDGPFPPEPDPPPLNINAHITSLEGSNVGCLVPGTNYKLKGNIGYEVACACPDIINGAQAGTVLLTNTNGCIDGQGEVEWTFHYGGGPLTFEIAAGCNPPHPGGSPIVDYDDVSATECCQPEPRWEVCTFESCGLHPDGCGGFHLCGLC